MPVEFVVLSGDYDVGALKAMAAGSAAGVLVSYVCMEDSSITHVVFKGSAVHSDSAAWSHLSWL